MRTAVVKWLGYVVAIGLPSLGSAGPIVYNPASGRRQATGWFYTNNNGVASAVAIINPALNGNPAALSLSIWA